MDTTSYVRGGGVKVWGIFSWYTLRLLIAISALSYLNFVAGYMPSFIVTVYPSANDSFQHNNAPCHKANHLKLVSDFIVLFN